MSQLPDDTLSNRLSKFMPIAITVNTFFKQESDKLSDEDLYRCLNDLKKQTNLIKKLKCVPGNLKMEFSPFNYDLTNERAETTPPSNCLLSNNYILTPELQLLRFPHLSQLQTGLPHKNPYHQPLLMHNHLLPIKEILEFPSYPVYEPNYLYRNILYVYPQTVYCGAGLIRSGASSTLTAGVGLNHSSSLGAMSSSARNIAVKINLMKGEEDHCALPVLFAKSSSTLEYCKEVFANVVYHNKTPQYHDEIKIKLPALLTGGNYHLLFTFYHVSCQNSKDQNQLESVIGYSWLPIQQQFQYETIIQLSNELQQPMTTQSASQLNQEANSNTTGSSFNNTSSTSSGNTSSQIGSNSSSTSFTSRCTMIKNGVYSLPICFEKLTSGYSNLNYSIFNSSSSFNLNNFNLSTDMEAANDSTEADADNVDTATANEPGQANVSTNITNLNNCSNSNFANVSLKSYFDVALKLVSTIHTQDVYLERFISLANLMRSSCIIQQQQQQQHGKTQPHGLNGASCRMNASQNDIEINFKKAVMDICFAESEALVKFL